MSEGTNSTSTDSGSSAMGALSAAAPNGGGAAAPPPAAQPFTPPAAPAPASASSLWSLGAEAAAGRARPKSLASAWRDLSGASQDRSAPDGFGPGLAAAFDAAGSYRRSARSSSGGWGAWAEADGGGGTLSPFASRISSLAEALESKAQRIAEAAKAVPETPPPPQAGAPAAGGLTASAVPGNGTAPKAGGGDLFALPAGFTLYDGFDTMQMSRQFDDAFAGRTDPFGFTAFDAAAAAASGGGAAQ